MIFFILEIWIKKNLKIENVGNEERWELVFVIFLLKKDFLVLVCLDLSLFFKGVWKYFC